MATVLRQQMLTLPGRIAGELGLGPGETQRLQNEIELVLDRLAGNREPSGSLLALLHPGDDGRRG